MFVCNFLTKCDKFKFRLVLTWLGLGRVLARDCGYCVDAKERAKCKYSKKSSNLHDDRSGCR